MRVLMKTTAAGPGGVRLSGVIVEVSAEEGAALIAGRFAERLGGERETATAEPPENAMMSAAKRRKVGR